MKQKRPLGKRILRMAGIALLIAIPALYIGLPVVFAVIAVFPYQEDVGAAPDGFDEVALTTADGVTLQAWYVAPTNGAAIVLAHGAGGSREGLRDHAALLVRHGYGVLALDLRGHGESGGTTNRFGWQGTADIQAAVAFLAARPEVTAIGGLGLSMGAEVLLGASADNPAMRAIVAEGATQRSVDELRALEAERPLYRNFTARVMYAAVGLLTGDDPPRPLLDTIQDAAGTQFLLIAAEKEAREIDYNTLFAETVGARAALWVAPDASHTGAYDRHPEEYEQRVIGFFDAELLGS